MLLQVKTKGARKIVYSEFVIALDHVAAKKHITTDELADAICGGGTPAHDQLYIALPYQGSICLHSVQKAKQKQSLVYSCLL